MKNEEIFLLADEVFLPELYRHEINLIGKESYLKLIIKFGGTTVYFPCRYSLTNSYNSNITKKWIEKVQLKDIKEQYRELAKTIGISNLYALCGYNERDSRYIPKLESLITNIKRNKVKDDLIKGKKTIDIARKYNVSERTIANIRKELISNKCKEKKGMNQ